MISLRYAWIVAIILALALIPTVIHSYLGLKASDGRQVKNIDTKLSGYTSRPTQRNANWGETIFNCFDWTERIYSDLSENKVRLFAGRSYDHKSLYHHPELTLSYGKNFTIKQQVSLSGPVEIPVKLLRYRDKIGLAAYALLYEDEFIGNPIKHQIKNSLNLLINAHKPITLFYVAQTDAAPATPFSDTPAAKILQQAIEDFRKK